MRLIGTAAALGLAFIAGLSAQQPPPQLDPELANRSAVTIKFQDVKLTNALEMMSKTSGVAITTTQDVKDAPNVTAEFKHATFTEVVTALLGPAGLTYKVVNKKTIVVFKPK
jgi:hypothetical protein